MKCDRTLRWSLVVAALLMLWAHPSLADGVLLRADDLTQRDRAALQAEIARARTQSPSLFSQVAKARDLAISLDARPHGRRATITPHLKRLGPAALLPMIDALAFDGPGRAGMSDRAWLTLRVGLLEAVGALRDARAIPVLEAVLDHPSVEPEVTRAAAEALGRVGTDRAARKLIDLSSKKGPKQRPVVQGMGDCRRLAVAQHLTSWLEKRPEDGIAVDLVKALGSVGNAWAWKTPTVRASEQDATRTLAAQTLLQVFVKYDGDVREAAAKALLVVDHPSTLSLIAAEQQRVKTGPLREHLDQLARRLIQSPIRNR